MTDAKKRLHDEVTTEIEISAKKTKQTHTRLVLIDKHAVHRLKVGTIIVLQRGGFSFYTVDSFTKGGAPRCFQLKHEHVVTWTDVTEFHTVDTLVGGRIEGGKPVVFRLTQDGLCSPEKRYSFYDEEIEYNKSYFFD